MLFINIVYSAIIKKILGGGVIMLLSALVETEKLISEAEEWLKVLLDYAIFIIDIIGAIVIISAVVKALIDIAKKNSFEKIDLAQTIAFGLELVMCGEILKTITTHTIEELMVLGAVVLIRGALALLTHWELKNEIHEKEHELEKITHEVEEEEKELKKIALEVEEEEKQLSAKRAARKAEK